MMFIQVANLHFCHVFIEEFRNAQTVFREKGGKIRNLDLEREEQRRKAGEKAVKDEKYAQWGKG